MKYFQDHAEARQKNYLSSLTGLRGFAALWVIFFHSRTMDLSVPITFFNIDVSLFFNVGWIGVHIFFILSGFLLSIPFIQWIENESKFPDLKKYYKRRLLRVFPAYYAQLFILLILAYTINYAEQLGIRDIVLHLFMFFQIEPWFIRPLEAAWWTLPIELSFYLALPLIGILFKRSSFLFILSISIALTISFRYIMFQYIDTQDMIMVISKIERFPGYLFLFILGMLTSFIFHKKPNISQAASSAMFFIGVIWIYACAKWLMDFVTPERYYDGHYSYFIWGSLNAIGIALIIYACAVKNWATELLFANRVMAFIGLISYSIYLWHFPVLRFIKAQVFPTITDNITLIVLTTAMPFIIILAALSYKFIEAPFIKLGSK